MKKEIKNSETSVEYIIQKQWKPIVSVVKDILLTKIQVSEKLKKKKRLMLFSNCAVCGKKKSTFIKNKELHNFD